MSEIPAIMMLMRMRIAHLCVLFALLSSIAAGEDLVDPQPSHDADPASPATSINSEFQSVSAATQPATFATTQDGEFLQRLSMPRGATSSEYPPPYQLLRYNENYEYLKVPALRSDAWDFLKYVPMLNRDGWYASFGGETRQRIETINNDGVGLLPYADTYYQQRYLLHGDFHFGKFIRFFGQMQSGFIDGRDAGPRPDIDRDMIDAHQAFADVVVPFDGDSIDESVTVRVGRQEMAYGSGRLIDVREGPTLRRSFDGARFLAKADKVSIDGWWTRPVRNEFGAFDDSPDPAHQFWGLYGTSPALLRPSGHLDLYYLGFEADSATYEQRHGPRSTSFAGNANLGSPKTRGSTTANMPGNSAHSLHFRLMPGPRRTLCATTFQIDH